MDSLNTLAVYIAATKIILALLWVVMAVWIAYTLPYTRDGYERHLKNQLIQEETDRATSGIGTKPIPLVDIKELD